MSNERGGLSLYDVTVIASGLGYDGRHDKDDYSHYQVVAQSIEQVVSVKFRLPDGSEARPLSVRWERYVDLVLVSQEETVPGQEIQKDSRDRRKSQYGEIGKDTSKKEAATAAIQQLAKDREKAEFFKWLKSELGLDLK